MTIRFVVFLSWRHIKFYCVSLTFCHSNSYSFLFVQRIVLPFFPLFISSLLLKINFLSIVQWPSYRFFSLSPSLRSSTSLPLPPFGYGRELFLVVEEAFLTPIKYGTILVKCLSKSSTMNTKFEHR